MVTRSVVPTSINCWLELLVTKGYKGRIFSSRVKSRSGIVVVYSMYSISIVVVGLRQQRQHARALKQEGSSCVLLLTRYIQRRRRPFFLP